MRFAIQTINNEVQHDFSRELIESIKYNNWIRGSNDYQYILTPEVLDMSGCICPCGSIEFVLEWMNVNHNIDIKPINVPESLFKYAGRKIINGTKEYFYDYFFAKSMDKIKGVTGYTESIFSSELIDINYQLSDKIEILSEYRCFVFKGELVGIKHYVGDFRLFPDIKTIESMINDYIEAPISYTIDIGILQNGNTVVIECHDFFSCGLYGFDRYEMLALMFYRWYKERINK